jgi:hypothetical protein
MKAIIGRVENCQDRQATPGYTLRLATTREEVEAAFLRFEVFNLELQDGFAEFFYLPSTRTNSIAFANTPLSEGQLEALLGKKTIKTDGSLLVFLQDSSLVRGSNFKVQRFLSPPK